MSRGIFYLVDVFAEQKYTGSPLAVVRGASSLSADEMHQIACEMNAGETAFIADRARGGAYTVRIFSPSGELPFEADPVLGAAYIIQREIMGQVSSEMVIKLPSAPVKVSRRADDTVWLQHNMAAFGEVFERERVAALLNIHPADLDERYPVRVASTGLPFVIAPVTTLAALQAVTVERAASHDFLAEAEARGVLVFASGTVHHGNDLSARIFTDFHGSAVEDAASGSATGCLGAYLLHHDYYQKPIINLRVEQGYSVSRPSLVLLRASMDDGRIQCHVGGKVMMIAKGNLL